MKTAHSAPITRPRVAYVVNTAMMAEFHLAGQFRALERRGFEVLLVAAPDPALERVARREDVRVVPVDIPRQMNPLADLPALRRLTKVLGEFRPHVVNAGNPKAGLLGMLAARRLKTPVRVYTLHGLRLETTRGWKRQLLLACERMASRCAHRVIPVSDSLRKTFLDLKLTRPEKISTIGEGSANGVDIRPFAVTPESTQRTAALRQQLGIPADAKVIGFVGRIVPDKGIAELSQAFREIAARDPNVHLVLVGGTESVDPLAPAVEESLKSQPRIHVTGFVRNPADYYRLFDVLTLPSYREGFPTVTLEGAACGLPIVGFASTGVVDAVRHDVTGRLVPVGDTAGLVRHLEAYLADPVLRARHGHAGQQRVIEQFAQEVYWDRLSEFYLAQMAAQGLNVQIPSRPLAAVA